MLGHLSAESLMDVVDGTASPAARAHVTSCAACRGRVKEAAEAWAAAEASVVPEPSPLYWDSFRRQVGRRIESERVRSWRPAWLLPLVAAAGILFALPFFRSPRVVPSPSPAVRVLPAWSALPPAEEDEGLAVLQAVASRDAEFASIDERGGIAELLSDLTDEESQALAEKLKAGVAKGGAL